ncbi:C-type lectin domain family 2 member D-like [Phalacrocorax carbo]|uniref:C-type lectin domain family 2 member D-like n=1 Tax=Phalacrocorax carbo TaxID=9209 RepID=UPI00311A4BB1
MKETRDYSGFLGAERRKRAGYSLEMEPEARVACQATMAVLFVALLITAVTFAVQAFQPRPQPCFRCPFDWIGYRGKCYYFSEAEGNWTSSQDNCSALGASLATLDSTEDLSFVMRYKGKSEHWIGLSREDEEQPWKWVNNSRLSHLFQIPGSGLCAHLNDNGLGSSRCSTERAWVCNKPELQSPSKGNRTRRAQNLCISSYEAAGSAPQTQRPGVR